MGEPITVTAIKYLEQDEGLFQIDIWYENTNESGRIFISLNDFFKLMTQDMQHK